MSHLYAVPDEPEEAPGSATQAVRDAAARFLADTTRWTTYESRDQLSDVTQQRMRQIDEQHALDAYQLRADIDIKSGALLNLELADNQDVIRTRRRNRRLNEISRYIATAMGVVGLLIGTWYAVRSSSTHHVPAGLGMSFGSTAFATYVNRQKRSKKPTE